MSEPRVHQFQAEVSQVLRLVINSLYSNHEVFLRELVSNASDALDRLRFRAISEPELLEALEQLRIRVRADRATGTLTIEDNGIGMTAEELERSLGTVAWSGSRDFVERLAASQDTSKRLQLIGQFGVGFYSAYLVADRVEVVSRAAGASEANRWVSDAKESFTIEPAERAERGTSVVLHLKAEHKDELTDSFRLRRLVERYSDYVEHPIELAVEVKKEGATELEYQKVNEASALWQRAQSEVTKDQYEELYKHLSHDWEPPLAWRHFKIEGTQMFAGILFVPRRRPFDLFDAGAKPHGLRLHVQRVFVLDEAQELVPRWLRFVRGVIDSEDLPLNVSRELLQDSRTVKVIRRQVVNQTLDLLEELAKERPEDYSAFFSEFGVVLKEGLHFEPEHKDRLARLLRFECTAGAGLISLDAYVDGMKADQPAIYYAAGVEREVLATSPHLEALRRRGWDVLLLTDPVDPFAVSALGSYRDKPLLSVTNADLTLPEENDKKEEREQARQQASPTIERFRKVLEAQVSEVRASDRLTDSPACLVVPEGGLQPHIERMLRAARQLDAPPSKRILEINLDHPLVRGLARLEESEPGSARVADLVRALYDQALLAEGSPVEDPARLARQLSALLTQAVTAQEPGPATGA